AAGQPTAQGAERPRSAVPAAARMDLNSIVERTLRLGLQTAEKSEATACATNVVFLVKKPPKQKDLKAHLDKWSDNLPVYEQGKAREQHPLGEKRVWLFAGVVTKLKTDLAQEPEHVQQAVATLESISVPQLERWVASMKPRYAEPKDGRSWVLELAVGSLCSAEFRKALDDLCSVDSDEWKIAPHRWGQTGLHKAAWDDLKMLSAANRQ
ncbi:unnamed protein product, partial [Prorocentrum cordatum]